MLFKAGPILDEAEMALLLHAAAVVELAHRGAERRFRLAVTLDRRDAARAKQSGQHGGDKSDDLAAAQVRKRDGIATASLLSIASVLFDLADSFTGQLQITVPIQSVPGEVQMSVEDDHGAFPSEENNH